MATNAELPVSRRAMDTPDIQELAEVLQGCLRICFESADVNVVDCPDLTKEPFTLAAPGICGNPRIADVGGVPYLVPLAQTNKQYNFDDVAKQVDLPGAFVVGAGAGPCKAIGTNCEMIANVRTKSEGSEGDNQTRLAAIVPEDGSYCLRRSPCTDFNLLGNFLFSEGKPGKVLEVKCKTRTGPDNLIATMRTMLHKHYGKDRFFGLGGVFLIEEGTAKIHIMPDFSQKPLNSEEDINKWLRFYDFKAPLVCLGVFVTHDPGMDLRLEHFHCFSHHGQGGHYHYDITPKTVSYRGYFVPAESMYRIDPPRETHQIGRD